MRRTLSAIAATGALIVGLAGPALAASTTYTDPAGDGDHGDRLDITGGTVNNRDRDLVVKTSYVSASPGHLVVFVKARGIPGSIRLISYLERDGGEHHVVIDSRNHRLPCPGLRGRWDTEDNTSRVRMPSSCFHDGDYGAVRVVLLTEIGAGSDADGTSRTDWVARG